MILSNISFGENVVIHPSTSINNVAFGNNIKIAKECTIYGSDEHVVKIGSRGNTKGASVNRNYWA